MGVAYPLVQLFLVHVAYEKKPHNFQLRIMTDGYGSCLSLHFGTRKTHQQDYKRDFSHKNENTPGSIS